LGSIGDYAVWHTLQVRFHRRNMRYHGGATGQSEPVGHGLFLCQEHSGRWPSQLRQRTVQRLLFSIDQIFQAPFIGQPDWKSIPLLLRVAWPATRKWIRSWNKKDEQLTLALVGVARWHSAEVHQQAWWIKLIVIVCRWKNYQRRLSALNRKQKAVWGLNTETPIGIVSWGLLVRRPTITKGLFAFPESRLV